MGSAARTGAAVAHGDWRGKGMFSFKYLDMDVSHNLLDRPEEAGAEWHEDHCHEKCIEIYAFLGGSAKMVVENRQKVLERGDLAVIMPYAMHRVKILDDVPYEYMSFKLPSAFISDLIADRLKRQGPFFKWPENVVFLNFIDEFYDTYRAEGDSDEMVYLGLGAWMSAMLIFLCRKDVQCDVPETEDVLVTEIKKFVDDNLSAKITMKTLCGRFHRSPSYIEKHFYRSTGERIMTYVRKRKMDLAEFLLANGARASDVAKSLSYTDYSSFYKAYVSVKGTPPTGSQGK